MKGFIRLFILGALIVTIASCSSLPAEDDLTGDEVVDSSDMTLPESDSGDEFADLDDAGSEETTDEQATTESPAGSDSTDEFADFEEEGTQQEQATAEAPAADQTADEELAFEEEAPASESAQEQAAAPVQETPPAPEAAPSEDIFADQPVAETPAPPAPIQESRPEVVTPSIPTANITDLKFKANETGGTVIVQGDQPLTYTTRLNPDLRQFIIEVENANLPDRLKRSLNTRDIKGSIGAIDAYQNPGSNTARFVIQLREGVAEPTVQLEGSSLLVVANSVSTPATSDGKSSEMPGVEGLTAVDGEESKILPSQNLQEFLAGNTKFYGKKISIETTDAMDVRDALNFITEESGVNMVIAEEVKGSVNLRLRQVPWDQALVVIMKMKKLGYTRQGNVLRIAPIQDLKGEEDEATRLAKERKGVEPLNVRMFPISYAKVEDLEKKIKDFLGDRGKVAGDTRTNSLVVTDIQENLDRVAKLIASLDTQPPQVLIESKIVEAQERFARNIGVNWSASGAAVRLGNGARGPVNMSPSFSINPGGSSNSGKFNFNLNVGTLDFFGTLQAALALSESEEQVKIISAPRILTMTNEKADISQSTDVPVRQTTVSNGVVTETFTQVPLALSLEVTPQVTADGSIIMKVQVKRQFKGADVSSAGQGAFSVNKREANTRVLVKNGQTAVIGGIYQSDATDGETGVPWFRELPVLGYLFKSKNISKEKSELLVFLTPRIINPPEATSAEAPVQDL